MSGTDATKISTNPAPSPKSPVDLEDADHRQREAGNHQHPCDHLEGPARGRGGATRGGFGPHPDHRRHGPRTRQLRGPAWAPRSRDLCPVVEGGVKAEPSKQTARQNREDPAWTGSGWRDGACEAPSRGSRARPGRDSSPPSRWRCCCRPGRSPLRRRASPPLLPRSSLAGRQQQAAKAYANLPVSFVENRGQIDARARYYAQGDRFGFFLTPKTDRDVVGQRQRAEPVAGGPAVPGAASTLEPQGVERAAGVVNDLRGSDPSQWRRGIPQYRQVVDRDLWSGIDLRLRDRSGVLKYEFLVRPGASPSDIELAYGGADGLALGRRRTPDPRPLPACCGTRRRSLPGHRRRAGARHQLLHAGPRRGRGGGFRSPWRRLPARPRGGDRPGRESLDLPRREQRRDRRRDRRRRRRHAIVAGTTQSPNFPTTSGAFRPYRRGVELRGCLRLEAESPPARRSSTRRSSAVATWNSATTRHRPGGNAYVTGTTKSSNFPTTGGAFDRTQNIPPTARGARRTSPDGFAFKLNAAGSAR